MRLKLIHRNGAYAIRRGWVFKYYLDLTIGHGPSIWWSKGDRYYKDCWTRDKELAETWFERLI